MGKEVMSGRPTTRRYSQQEKARAVRLVRQRRKSDTLDAEAAARAVLGGQALAIPKSADGSTEMIRHVKIARDTARKARTSAIVTLKAVIVTAPAELRDQLAGLSDKVLIDRCTSLRAGAVTSPTASTKHTLRALAKRFHALDNEIRDHDAILDDLTAPPHPPCAKPSASAPTPRPRCSSCSVTIPSGSTPRPRSPRSAAPAPFPRPPA